MDIYTGTMKILVTKILTMAFYQMENSVPILKSTTAAGIFCMGFYL